MAWLSAILADPLWASVAILGGFVLLVYGADWLVDGASGLAKRWGISELVIGLTVVAFGTSMPEFMVSTIAAIQHNTEIAITNILGSNAINTCIILGLSAVIYPICSQKQSRKFDIPWALLAGVLVLFFATYTRPMSMSWGNWGAFNFEFGFISGIGGSVLLLCFLIFMWHSIHFGAEGMKGADSVLKAEGMKGGEAEGMKGADSVLKAEGLGKALMLVIIGLAGLVIGGELIVNAATSIAHTMGVSDAIIGLTIVALGTSLPELATSCVAAAKKNSDLALGNVIGSNIFNVFFILGTSALIHPLPTYTGLWLDAVIVTLSAAMVVAFVYLNKQHRIERWHGALLIAVYAGYLTYRLMTL